MIAASYSYAELLDEKGVGASTSLEHRDWLLGHGFTLEADARDIRIVELTDANLNQLNAERFSPLLERSHSDEGKDCHADDID